jgi:hypothetical protein
MRKLFSVIAVLVGGFAMQLQAQSMREAFLKAPEELFPLLTDLCRADLIDYFDAGMTAKVTNKLDGVTVLESLDDDFMQIATTRSSSVQVKMLPCADDTLFCVVRSVKAEVADSRIDFYDSNWNRLPVDGRFAYPAISDFFVSDAEKYIGLCDMYLVSLTLNADDCTMVAEYTMPAYMNDGDAEKVLPLLRRIVYRWNGKRFVIG